jgi:hypothetical protein
MWSFLSRVLAITILGLLSSSSSLSAQSAPQAQSPLVDRCIRWLEAIVPNPDRDKLDVAKFCRGYRTGNVDGLWSDCKSPGNSGQPPSHCSFEGRVMPGDTLALAISTPSHDGHEFLDAAAESGSDPYGVTATLYSRTDFVIDGTRMVAGLYRISPHKSGDSWELNFARLKREWNDPVAPEQFLWHASMKSNEDVQPTETLIYQMWILSKHCGAPSRVSSLREFEFRFGETDVSLCLDVMQAAPDPRDEVSKR